MYEWTTLYASRRNEELRQDREKLRLIKQAMQARQKRTYRPVLARLGQQFVTWGASLQQRYDTVETFPTLKSVRRES